MKRLKRNEGNFRDLKFSTFPGSGGSTRRFPEFWGYCVLGEVWRNHKRGIVPYKPITNQIHCTVLGHNGCR